MRQVIGSQVRELSEAEFRDRAGQFTAVLLDVGTGDGKHTLHLARQRPDWLIVGMDANCDNMRRAATRAAAKPARGGLANAIFVWAAAEQLPAALDGVAAQVHVLMPWGSLLRGLLGAGPATLRPPGAVAGAGILGNLWQASAPGALLLVTFNLHAWRPPVPEVDGLPEPHPQSARTDLAESYRRAGWQVLDASYLSREEIAALGTSWTRRLGSSRQRLEALAVRAVRLDAPAT